MTAREADTRNGELTNMRAATLATLPQLAHGVLQRIDLISREVKVAQGNTSVTYSIAPDCEILLNGERIKLRMLQPRDHVRIAYRLRAQCPTALSVEALTRPVTSQGKGPAGFSVT